MSDVLDHSKPTIFAYLNKVFSKIPKTIKVIRIWSDGPSNQFKNKYMAAALKILETKFSKKIIWNYHATAHGKACIDGVGAVAKKKVKRLIRTRKAIVNCAKDFVLAFKTEPSKVELFEMSSTDINKINTTMKFDDVVNTAQSVKDIFKCHQLQCINKNVQGFLFSKDGYSSLKM